MRHVLYSQDHPYAAREVAWIGGESVGAIVRRVCRMRVCVPVHVLAEHQTKAAAAHERHWPGSRGCIIVEFDLIDGSGMYLTTGFMALSPDDLAPIGVPVATPIGFEAAVSPCGQSGPYSPVEAHDRLVRHLAERRDLYLGPRRRGLRDP